MFIRCQLCSRLLMHGALSRHTVFASVAMAGGTHLGTNKTVICVSFKQAGPGVAQLSGHSLVVPRHRACLNVEMSSSHTFRRVVLTNAVDDRLHFTRTIGRSDEIKRSQLHCLQVFL